MSGPTGAGKTTFADLMIAHREESLARCDRMLRFQNCRVIADEPALSA
jgi:ABC-type transport system involved in cytochrome bd biosynthesis fused ATPase/permease subunit